MTAELMPTSNVDRQISRNIKIAIFDSGLLQKEVALAAGLHPGSMTMSMHGKRPWRAEEVLLIARATGVDVTDLLPRLDSNQQPSGYVSPLVRGSNAGAACRHLRLVKSA